jgi:hypothetical protein
LIFSQFSLRSDRYGASARLEMIPSQFQLGGMFEHLLTISDQVFGKQHWIRRVALT